MGMSSNQGNKPISRDVVLVGAGAAHLQVLASLAMRRLPESFVTLVAEAMEVPYSAMVPRWLTGEVNRSEVCFDLLPLCREAGVRLLVGGAERIERARREVILRDGRRVPYDLLSLAVGARPGAGGRSLRPLSRFLDEVEAMRDPGAIALRGAGATGCELALAFQARFPGAAVMVFHAGEGVLPEYPKKAGDWMTRKLVAAGIRIETGEPEAEYVFDATTPRPPDLFESLDLRKDEEGFLLVDKRLRTEDPTILASGDCVSHEAYPWLKRNGVQAVRAGRVLVRNLRDEARVFRPAKRVLSILNLSDGTALARKGSWVGAGRWALRWKQRIDRRWAERFRPLDREKAVPPMFCGGCAAKFPANELEGVLGGIGEDASVVPVGNGRVRLESVDFFRAFHDDARFLGRVAAVHALSDLHAMNAEPRSAQSVVTLPRHLSTSLKRRWLGEILEGAKEALAEEGVVLLGGHTSEGEELALGFSVLGEGEEGRLFLKRNFREGRVLILTKPLGTGAMLAAWSAGRLKGAQWEGLAAGMRESNAKARKVLAEAGVDAATDVTGFGLAGHLVDCLKKSGTSARVESLPEYEGFQEVTARGFRSSLWESNYRAVRDEVTGKDFSLACDPQTSGGLLAAIPQELEHTVLERLREAGSAASRIGEVVKKSVHLVTFP